MGLCCLVVRYFENISANAKIQIGGEFILQVGEGVSDLKRLCMGVDRSMESPYDGEVGF